MADWFRMLFGMVSGVDRAIGVLDGGDDHRRGRSCFVGEFRVSHCNQWGLCCVVVQERCALRKWLWGGLVPISTHTVDCAVEVDGPVFLVIDYTRTRAHTHTNILRLSRLCPGQPGWVGTRRNIHPLTPIMVIDHPLSASSIHGILPVQFTCLTVFFHNLSPSFLWSTCWPGTLHFILHTFLHPIIDPIISSLLFTICFAIWKISFWWLDHLNHNLLLLCYLCLSFRNIMCLKFCCLSLLCVFVRCHILLVILIRNNTMQHGISCIAGDTGILCSVRCEVILS